MTTDTEDEWSRKSVAFEQAFQQDEDDTSGKVSIRQAVFNLAPVISRLRDKRKSWARIADQIGLLIGCDDVKPVTVKNYHSDWKRLNPKEWAAIRDSKRRAASAGLDAGIAHDAEPAVLSQRTLGGIASPPTPAIDPDGGMSADGLRRPAPQAPKPAGAARHGENAPPYAFVIKPDPK